ncbi:MAG: DUF4907 domain-containing protein [Bacteroidetes bacterium]|nr:DUF4907 domain-containing protein [Bacteroidota bacterium]
MKNKFLIPGILVVLGILFFTIYYRQLKKEHGYALIEMRAIPTLSGGWGYEVLANGKPYIHQEFIPAVPGHYAFKTKEHALKVASKVVEKMKQGQQLPTISIEELSQMGVLSDTLP